MSTLEWIDGVSYRVPAKTLSGDYQVWIFAAGTRGPAYRAHHFVGVGIETAIGDNRLTLDEAKADAQIHSDELHRQASAAAKDPTA